MSASPELAIQVFLSEFCRPDGQPEQYLFTDEQHRQVLWPYLPAAESPAAAKNPDEYSRVVQSLQAVVWPRLLSLRDDCQTVERVRYRREPEQYGPFTLHYPAVVAVRGQKAGARRELELFRTILEYQGRYKLIQLGPD